MPHEILKDCKKCLILRVVSPNLFWMTEYENKRSYKRDVKRLENLLAKNVEQLSDSRKIPKGKVIAVKSEEGFHRGVVTDIFSRSYLTVCCILLIDYGNVIETNFKNIYLIKNRDLRHKKLNAFEVSIQGIQPAEMKIECEKSFSGGIFQKRACNNWSPSAMKFVINLIMKKPYVFVKSIQFERKIISGEIYFIEEPEGVPVSLGQQLCDKGFAVTCDISLKTENDQQGDIDIDKNIPKDALFPKSQVF